MRVKDVMTSEVKTCYMDTNLASVAMMMFEHDCGVLPVVNHRNKVIGMITDRDIAIATGMKGIPASDIAVGEIISGHVYSVTANEDIHTALKTMRHNRVRRLPVIDDEGMLKGILSLNDVLLRAEEKKGKRHPDLNYEDAMSTVKAICEHRPAHRAIAA